MSRLRCCFLSFAFFLGTGGLSQAASTKVFTVENLGLAAAAANATRAKNDALAKGKQQAFRLLVERLALREDLKEVTWPSGEEIDRYIESITLGQEDQAANSYSGTATYVFSGEAIRRLFEEWNLRHSEIFSLPVLILPLTEDETLAAQWTQAFIKSSSTWGLVPFSILGQHFFMSKEDIRTAVDQKDDGFFRALLNQRQARIVVIADLQERGGTAVGGHFIAYGLGGYQWDQDIEDDLDKEEGETQASARQRNMASVARRLLYSLEEEWKKQNLLVGGNGESGEIALQFSIDRLSTLARIEATLEKAALVKDFYPIFVSDKKVLMYVRYESTQQQLDNVLREAGLKIRKTGDDMWEAWF